MSDLFRTCTRNFFVAPLFDHLNRIQPHTNLMKKTSRHGFTLIEIMIVVAIIGVIAAIAIPSFGKAIETSRKKACAINRKNIDGVKAAWALDNQKPTDATPTDADLFGDATYIEHKPDCPAGGEYALNSMREKCTCSVPVHTN